MTWPDRILCIRTHQSRAMRFPIIVSKWMGDILLALWLAFICSPTTLTSAHFGLFCRRSQHLRPLDVLSSTCFCCRLAGCSYGRTMRNTCTVGQGLRQLWLQLRLQLTSVVKESREGLFHALRFYPPTTPIRRYLITSYAAALTQKKMS